MVIAIDLTSLSYHLTGIERYAMCISEQMLEIDEENKYVLIFRNTIAPIFQKKIDGKRIQARIIKGNNKLLFYQWVLPYHLKKIKADRYLFFAFTSPILFRKPGIYNTIHDMGAWDWAEAMKFFQKWYWKATIRLSASVSDGIVTVSHFSKERISKILKYPSDKINVIYSAVYGGIMKGSGAKFDDIKKKYNLPDRYIMTLSTLEPRKNMELLLETYSEIKDKVDYDLVLVGRKGWMMDEVLKKYGSDHRIHVTDFVEDEHISAIYKQALCFVFPSLYEGFGLPPIEALALGTAVIASDAASIPEILMDRALYFKSNDKSELKSLLLVFENNLAEMPHGLNDFQLENYSFKKSAEKVLEFISESKLRN